MSDPPLWLLKAIAGKANAVAWPDSFQCKYKVESVTTGLYPIEPIEDVSAAGLVFSAQLQEVVVESYLPTAILTAGHVTEILRQVTHAQEPEYYTPACILTTGEVYQIYTDVLHTQAPESYRPACILTCGEMAYFPPTEDVQTTMPPDEIVANAAVTTWELI